MMKEEKEEYSSKVLKQAKDSIIFNNEEDKKKFEEFISNITRKNIKWKLKFDPSSNVLQCLNYQFIIHHLEHHSKQFEIDLSNEGVRIEMKAELGLQKLTLNWGDVNFKKTTDEEAEVESYRLGRIDGAAITLSYDPLDC